VPAGCSIVHTALALLRAKFIGADIVHIHAIGPALMVPFAKLLGLRVVLTHHGFDYKRDKWNRFAKTVLKLGEKMGCRYADEVISISTEISDTIEERANRKANLIYNGVEIPKLAETNDYITGLGLTPGKYFLAVARFVPEKGLTDLISAFSRLKTDWKLVIAGDADHETIYSQQLKKMARETDKVVLSGYIHGDSLNELYSHAGLFVLPSYHEGLPISLLEALSYGLKVLVSDIKPNKEIGLDTDRYFPVSNIKALAEKMQQQSSEVSVSKQERIRQIEMVKQKYNWDKIAQQVLLVYKNVLDR